MIRKNICVINKEFWTSIFRYANFISLLRAKAELGNVLKMIWINQINLLKRRYAVVLMANLIKILYLIFRYCLF